MVVGHQFKMIPEKYKPLIYKQKLHTLYFYFLVLFVVIIFEMLSVGLVPLFVLSLTDHNEVISKIFNTIGVSESFYDLDKKQTVIFFYNPFVSLLIKNFIIGWINYLQSKILRDYKISTSKLLYEYYIRTNFKFFCQQIHRPLLGISPQMLVILLITLLQNKNVA